MQIDTTRFPLFGIIAVGWAFGAWGGAAGPLPLWFTAGTWKALVTTTFWQSPPRWVRHGLYDLGALSADPEHSSLGYADRYVSELTLSRWLVLDRQDSSLSPDSFVVHDSSLLLTFEVKEPIRKRNSTGTEWPE